MVSNRVNIDVKYGTVHNPQSTIHMPFVPPLILLGKRSRSSGDDEDDEDDEQRIIHRIGRVDRMDRMDRMDRVTEYPEYPSDAFCILRQPGDGACLFHSLGCLSRPPKAAAVVRAELVDYMRRNAEREVQGVALSKWIYWESRMSMAEYCARMSRSDRWGGAVEISVYSLMNSTPVEVYERRGAFFRRIAHVLHGTDTATEQQQLPVVHLLYSGRSHYDAMKLASAQPGIELTIHPRHQGFPRLAGSRV